jgi:hypothetical protein
MTALDSRQDPAALRVALLTNFIPPYRLPLYRALAQRVSDLCVVISTSMEANRQWAVQWDDLAVQVQRTLTLRRTWRHPQGFAEPLSMHLPYDTLPLLRRYRPDVIISGELGLRTLQAMLYRRLHPSSRIIIWGTLSEHTEQNRGRLRLALRRWLLRQADAVVVNGQSGVRYIQRFAVPRERIFIVPYTTDIAPLVALPTTRMPEQAYRLLAVGQLIERKGLATLLAALARYAQQHPERSVACWLAGDGPLRGSLEQTALPPNVQLTFLGNVPYALLPQVYAQAGLLVFPTMADEWGLVVNEAMAAGVPVLGSRYSQAVEELVTEDETGWTFRPDHPDELDAALERALAMAPERLNAMRQAARARIRPLTPEAGADSFMQAVRYVC